MEKMILISICLVALFHATQVRGRFLRETCKDEEILRGGSIDCAQPNNTRLCSSDFFVRSLCKKSCNLCGCEYVTGNTGDGCNSPPLGPPVTEESLGSCGQREMRSYGVIAGNDATAGKWPWQLELLERKSTTLEHICGATLISKRWAVTAAHCMSPDIKPSSYIVRAGELIREVPEGTEEEVGLSKFIIHPRYNLDEAMNNDIAVMKFDRDIKFTNYIQPACLPSPFEPSDECYITGWGMDQKRKKNHNPVYAKQLQEARLPIVDHKTCNTKMQAYLTSLGFPDYRIKNGMICAGDPDAPQSGCFGDSGGPLVCRNKQGRWELRGAVSHGTRDCDSNAGYSVFARISHYKEWILEQMRK